MLQIFAASFAAAICGLLLLRTILSMKSIFYLFGRWWRWTEDHCNAHQIYNIPRFSDDDNSQENPLFRKSILYLTSLPSVEDSDQANVLSSSRKPNDFSFQPEHGRTISDSFRRARISWTVSATCLHLRLRRQDRHRVLRPYLQHVEALADETESRKRKELRLYTLGRDSTGWTSIPFHHPSSLDTIAVDPELKNRLKIDLENFLKGKAYYARLGRVWKRSYLLYGPPGTGKSSFVSAMARFLCYDVYDLDISRVSLGSGDLKPLLLKTCPKSVILVEDLDRYLSSRGKEDLVAMLNFMDGVFSFCGEERVMVFTMSSSGKESIDPAILRPGRLDVHIYFPLCDFSAFKTLSSSYLGLKDHKLYPQVEEGFQRGAKLSHAEVGEIMIANRVFPSRALKTVINALQQSSVSVSDSGSACVEELEVGCSSPALGFGKEATVREFKKLYGFIKMRGGSRKEGTMSVEMAAAAAAAANAALHHDRSFDKEEG